MFQTNGLSSINMGFFIQEHLPIKPYRLALHKQRVGRVMSQNILLSNCSIDPIFVYIEKKSCNKKLLFAQTVL